MEEWCLKAVDALQDLLTLMNLTGGGPSRGTEIVSFALRNTSARRRSFYFNGSEIMIVPTFTKTDAMNGGKTEFISRHLDRETSYLFKVYFLLIHPAVVAFDDALPQDTSRTDIQRKYRKFALRNGICLGRMRAEEVWSVIGATFSEYDIPSRSQSTATCSEGL